MILPDFLFYSNGFLGIVDNLWIYTSFNRLIIFENKAEIFVKKDFPIIFSPIKPEIHWLVERMTSCFATVHQAFCTSSIIQHPAGLLGQIEPIDCRHWIETLRSFA